MKKLIFIATLLTLLIATVTLANPSSALDDPTYRDFKSDACDYFDNTKALLGPMTLTQHGYRRTSDGQFVEYRVQVENRGLKDGIQKMTAICSHPAAEFTIANLVEALNKIATNIVEPCQQREILDLAKIGLNLWGKNL